MQKQQFREKYLQERAKLTPKQISEKSLDISDRLIQLFKLNNKMVHIFLPIFERKEINTWLAVDRLMSICQVVVSRSNFETYEMEHVFLTKEVRIELNNWGIPEPIGGEQVNANKLEVVIVPLLAFDKKGYRVGYGKGFYDKFLEGVSPTCLKIGLSFFEVDENFIDINSHDIPLDYCVTPATLYTFAQT